MRHDGSEPSAWLLRHAGLVPGAGATGLDVAAGAGRHVRWMLARGLRVTAVDRDPQAVAAWPAGVEAIEADLEGAAWPLAGRRFDLVVVANYLWRPALAAIVESVAAGGVLVYETYARGQEAFGRPRNPAFLLAPRELLEATRALCPLAFEDLVLDDPPRAVQRLVARRERSLESSG